MTKISVKAAQQKLLSELNDAVLPKFKTREVFQMELTTCTNPILRIALEANILEVRNQIVEEVITKAPEFLDAIAHSWNNHFTFDEARSFVLENLVESTERYKSTKKPFCRFTSFFWMFNKNLMRNKVKNLHAAKRDDRKTFSLDSLLSPDQDNEDNISSGYDVLKEVEEDPLRTYATRAALQKLYKDSNNKQKRVLKRLYLGYSRSEIARSLNISSTNVNNVIGRIRENLLEIM